MKFVSILTLLMLAAIPAAAVMPVPGTPVAVTSGVTYELIGTYDTKLSFRLDEIVVLETVGLAMQSAIEHVATADGAARGAAVATNVFMRTPSGWRMVCHHASPIASVAMPAPSGPLH